MLFGEIITVALGALRANKLRSLLTMLGIVIGVAAVIAVVALGAGAQRAVNDRISSLGTTLLTVMPGQQRGMGVTFDQSMKLTMADAKAIEEKTTTLNAVQPEINSRAQVQYQNQNTSTSIVGTTANYLDVRKYQLAAGRMFTRAEDEGKQRLAVLGQTVLTSLGIRSPDAILGESIRIKGLQFTVVGILKSKGQSSPFGDPDDQVLIPITRAVFGFSAPIACARSVCLHRRRTRSPTRWPTCSASFDASIGWCQVSRTTSRFAARRTS